MKNVTKDLQLNRKENDSMLKVKTTVNRFQAKNKDMALQFVPAMKNNFSYNFKSDIVEVTLDELEKAILSGKSIIPAVVEKNIIDANFKEQQLFMIDIDDADCGLEELLGRFEDYKPCMIYTSFSSTKKHPKYRFVFIANKILKTVEEARNVNLALMKIAKCADIRCKDVSRIFFAGKEVIYKDEVVFDVDRLLSEVDIEQYKELPQMKNDFCKAIRDNEVKVYEALYEGSVVIHLEDVEANLRKMKQFKGTVVDYNESFEWFNKNIKLTDVLGKELNEKFRCVSRFHLDEHPSASITEYKGQQYYRCSCNDFHSPKALVDALAYFLDMSKTKVTIMLADILGVEICSEYQKQVILSMAMLKKEKARIVEPGSILDKEMKYLWGAYFCILDMVAENCPAVPITKDESKISFFMSEKTLADRMTMLKMSGATGAKKKIDQLKELGLIRALPEDEIRPVVLEKSKSIQEWLKGELNNKAIKRVECYELVELNPTTIMIAEEFIKERKQLGVKKCNNNITRRINGLGVTKTQECHVQTNVIEKAESKKLEKTKAKMAKCAEELIQEQGYFTIDDLRRKYDPKRKMKKVVCEKLIDDYIPALISEFGYEKSRVKNETRKKFNIPAKFKTNTIIFIRNN